MITDEWIAQNAERINWVTNTCGDAEAGAILGTLFLLNFTDEQWDQFVTGGADEYMIWLLEIAERFRALGVNVA